MNTDIFALIEENYLNGYCTTCKEITREGDVEPDAMGYDCPACGNNTVMGFETAILLEKINLEDY